MSGRSCQSHGKVNSKDVHAMGCWHCHWKLSPPFFRIPNPNPPTTNPPVLLWHLQLEQRGKEGSHTFSGRPSIMSSMIFADRRMRWVYRRGLECCGQCCGECCNVGAGNERESGIQLFKRHTHTHTHTHTRTHTHKHTRAHAQTCSVSGRAAKSAVWLFCTKPLNASTSCPRGACGVPSPASASLSSH